MILDRDIALLTALDALLEEVNVTRAARRLCISQPSLSAKLGRLRDLYRDPLLVRSGDGRGMVLTPLATQLRAKVRAALEATAAAFSVEAFDPARSEAVIRIIANDNAVALTLSVLLADLSAHGAQGLRVAILRPDARSISERLAAGDADLAVGLDPGGLDTASLIRCPVFEDRYVTIQRKGHPRGAGLLDLNQFCAAAHLLISHEEAGFQGVVDAALAKQGRERRVSLSIHSYAIAPLIVAHTDLITTLPGRLSEPFAGLIDTFDPPIDLGTFVPVVLWHERTQNDPAALWVRQRIFASAPADPLPGGQV